jgi:hypothetical protein
MVNGAGLVRAHHAKLGGLITPRPRRGSTTSVALPAGTGRQKRLLGRRPNPNTYRITAGSFADPDFRRQVVHHSSMETSDVARSERSTLRSVFAQNEPEAARTEGSGDGEMRYRRATIVADDWHGEFGSYDEWARLGPQPPYRSATFFDAHGRRCITQRDFARARDDRAFPLRYRWERTERRKRR